MLTELEILSALNAIFRDVSMNENLILTAALTAKDVDWWDSMKHIEILIATEAHFGIKFNTQELDSLQSAGDLMRLIAKKCA